jgi:hypothetical protein
VTVILALFFFAVVRYTALVSVSVGLVLPKNPLFIFLIKLASVQLYGATVVFPKQLFPGQSLVMVQPPVYVLSRPNNVLVFVVRFSLPVTDSILADTIVHSNFIGVALSTSFIISIST